MQAETGPTCIAARREEGIECLASDLRTHAAAIIRKDNFNVVLVELPSLDINCPRSTVGERVSGRIEKQIGKYLTVWSWIAIHCNIGLALNVKGGAKPMKGRP